MTDFNEFNYEIGMDYRKYNCDEIRHALTKWNAIFPDEKVHNISKLKKAELVDACERLDFTRYYKEHKIYYFLTTANKAKQYIFNDIEADIKKVIKTADDKSVSGYYEVLSDVDDKITARLYAWYGSSKPVWNKIFVYKRGDDFDDLLKGLQRDFYIQLEHKQVSCWSCY